MQALPPSILESMEKEINFLVFTSSLKASASRASILTKFKSNSEIRPCFRAVSF
ncbi:MAG: hypothetical protein ACKO3R_00120 [bacterium]